MATFRGDGGKKGVSPKALGMLLFPESLFVGGANWKKDGPYQEAVRRRG